MSRRSSRTAPGPSAPTLQMRPGAIGGLGEFAAGWGTELLVVTDEGIAAHTPHLEAVLSTLREQAMDPAVHAISAGECGYVSSAASIREAMRREQPGLCLALGGGSVVDAAKLAVATVREPWLLDTAVWSNEAGALSRPAPAAHGRRPAVLAVPTMPGSAAHVSDRVCLAAGPGRTRRLVQGSALVPAGTVVDADLSRTLGAPMLLQSTCEVLYRMLSAYLVTPGSSRSQDRRSAEQIARLVELGSGMLATGELTREQHAELHALSVRSMVGRDLSRDPPKSHPWWCIQNSMLSDLACSKGLLSAQALPHILARVDDGDTRFGLWDRWRTLQRRLAKRGLPSRRLHEVLHEVGASAPESPTRGSADTVRRWARDTYVLWADLVPDIRSLGVGGVRSFLRSAGFEHGAKELEGEELESGEHASYA